MNKSKTYRFVLNNEVSANKTIKIPVESSLLGSNSSNGASPDPNSKNWLVRVHTSDLTGKKMEGTDARVYIGLIEKNMPSEIVTLDKSRVTKKANNNIFESGNVDEFLIQTPKSFKTVDKIRIGHDNSGFGNLNELKTKHINK